MRLTDYLDKGASLGAAAPCLTTAGRTLSYFDVQRLSWRTARALDRAGIGPGDKVAILSANDPVATLSPGTIPERSSARAIRHDSRWTSK